MDSNIKTNLLENLQEQIIKRKAMFIPMLFVTTFGLVGYAAVDKEAPVIGANKIEVLYGTKLDKSMFAISDNQDSLEAIDVQINDKSYDPYQLGIYNVEVTATDLFSNVSLPKTVQVEVVDKTAPDLKPVGKSNGYVIDVPVKGSNDITKYVQATDNVDGDVTPFIETNQKLDTSKLGTQTIELSVSDTVGNVTKQTYEFFVSDTQAPNISYKKGSTVTVDYGSKFSYSDYVDITDNFDKEVASIKVDGTVNTKEIGSTTLNLTAVDSSGNESKATLKVDVKDISAPTINLSKTSLTITTGKSFNAKGYLNSAIDNKDGNVTSKVKISDSVNTDKAGKYSVKYTVTDAAGNTASKTLSVKVENPIPTNAGAASSALSRVGSRYVNGGSGPNAFDCSGLTQWAYRQNGISIPRTAAAQYSATSRVSKSSLKAGDLVFFKGTTGKGGITHVGIYVGGGRFVHAGTSRTGVTTANLNSSYWTSHWAGGGRK
ncbi:C40 family peptidase [Candidatus Stoquefichus massiliensis]|uniref:C40 family peptidase n=1 Tax=Candidatus Stoquefichus massiliensis TaxID=1470350 RepID=UPI000486C446|nr:C40 family peptidase [Candidatus Stoquefichus massiliensis]